ncbi:hypothetical protein Slin_3792 [Spirosoma linguale DSM 74]|uniref:Uncharacterized protein n=1 Tax=Spirosoma linguale (strain ATCC 33905 / DSM 74 / LMG 10896 / Claus 1) TaxID=504472 RepID=D2QC52_SPILD|nr:hypothetical protein Slin_3792 [Spirosoma linguale DSM 74]
MAIQKTICEQLITGNLDFLIACFSPLSESLDSRDFITN